MALPSGAARPRAPEGPPSPLLARWGAGPCVAPSLRAPPERQRLLRLRFLVGSQLAQTCSKAGGTAFVFAGGCQVGAGAPAGGRLPASAGPAGFGGGGRPASPGRRRLLSPRATGARRLETTPPPSLLLQVTQGPGAESRLSLCPLPAAGMASALLRGMAGGSEGRWDQLPRALLA